MTKKKNFLEKHRKKLVLEIVLSAPESCFQHKIEH